MRSNKVLICILLVSMCILGGCTQTKTTEINVLATTDLHGEVPYHMVEYINQERQKDPDITLVDAGDFYDRQEYGTAMDKYFEEKIVIKDGIIEGSDNYVEFPLANDMGDVGYDAVVLGNHEFVSNNRFHLDNMISDFEKNKVDVLSANTYKDNNESYVKPYTIKEVEVDGETIKLGILGLTIKEIGEGKYTDEDGNIVEEKSRELKDQYGYDGKLYINDLVEDAEKWVQVMKEKENTDIIVAVAHSGEEPKKPKNPGNRIQDLAQNIDGIDAIVAGHTHVAFEQHDYTNKSGENVIVTQPGKHGEHISKITFEIKKEKDGWEIEDKYAKLTKFEEDNSEEYIQEFFANLTKIDEDVKEVSLSDITPFEWDKAYIVDTNTPISTIYDKVGYKFKSIREKEKDSDNQIIFMKDDKVELYFYTDGDIFPVGINFDKASYKNGLIELNPKENDMFSVKQNKELYEIDLTHIN